VGGWAEGRPIKRGGGGGGGGERGEGGDVLGARSFQVNMTRSNILEHPETYNQKSL
jgi:hypothetical protein